MPRIALFCLVFLAAACERHDAVGVIQPKPSHKEIGIAESGYVLSFDLPDDAWTAVEGDDRAFDYAKGGEKIHLVLDLRSEALVAKTALVDEIRQGYADDGAEITVPETIPFSSRAGFDAVCLRCAEGPHRASHRVIRLGVWPEVTIHAAWRGPVDEASPIESFMATFRLVRS